MNQVLTRLLKELDYSRIRSTGQTELVNKLPRHERESTSDVITHDYLWPTLGNWFKERDVIVTET